MTLMQKLIDWQQIQARKEHLEPYMVLQFNTIKEIARLCPKTHDDLIRIKGIGPAKVRKYGDEVLKIVRGDGVVGDDVFSEADAVNQAALTSENPSNADIQFDPETGEIIEEKKDDTVSVTEFVTMLDTALRTQFRSVRVQGEVVGFKQNANGHVYFEVKDRQSVLRCAVFRSSYELSGVALEDGMEIVVTGHPNYHKQYGFSFVGNVVELYGEGALKKAYDKLKKKLSDEGLFSPDRKRALPQLPEKIGLITSRTGAAIGDFTSNIGQYGYKITFHHTSVEGVHALAEIKKALETMAAKDIDVLVLVRGGGSLESLQAFNNEQIIRMIADFPVPVIVGVGHDEDETIATLVADIGASTPTGAARAVRESWDQCEKQLQNYQQSLMQSFDSVLSKQVGNFELLERDIFAHLSRIIDSFNEVIRRFFFVIQKIDVRIHTKKADMVRAQERQVELFEQKIERAKNLFDISRPVMVLQENINKKNERLHFYQKTLVQNNPERQLSLGYSIARDSSGTIVRSVDDVKKDDTVDVQLNDGEVHTKVQ